MNKVEYLKRIFSNYLTKRVSQLTFWHEKPTINEHAAYDKLGQFYQDFTEKADYSEYFDTKGVILLDYHGNIGKQYYPIAIAQYGLACFNRYKVTGEKKWLNKALIQAKWLVENIREDKNKCYLWYTSFDWEYRQILRAPWPSALAQGNGISLLARFYKETEDEKYLDICKKAYRSLVTEIKNGGVAYIDSNNDLWLEEYIVKPPSHILNGFMWTMMGVWDYYLLTGDEQALNTFKKCIETIKRNIHRFDIGFWSLYDMPYGSIKNPASSFYHSLHIAQLEILYRMSGEKLLGNYCQKWQKYRGNLGYKWLSQVYKGIFKIFYY